MTYAEFVQLINMPQMLALIASVAFCLTVVIWLVVEARRP